MKNFCDNTYLNHIDQWDKRIILKYNKIDNKIIIYLLKFISFFGRETVWIFLITFFLFIWYDPLFLSYIGSTFINGIWLNVVIKSIINRERPFKSLKDLRILEPKPTSKSFPSWHMYNGTSQAIILSFLLKLRFFTIILLIFALIIGFSRIILGVHYPSDVIGGFILGIGGAIITLLIFGPLLLSLITFLEQYSLIEIQYRNINPLLGEFWYLMICILIFGLIIFSAAYKYFKKEEENGRN